MEVEVGVGRKWCKLITNHPRNLSEEANDVFVASSNPICVILTFVYKGICLKYKLAGHCVLITVSIEVNFNAYQRGILTLKVLFML